MKVLKADWLTDGLVDFEYKKYILLDYLQNVNENFNRQELYPYLSDLLFHYRNLLSVKENKKLIYDNFPSSITEADFKKLKLNYEKIVEEDAIMKEIEEILEFSIPQFKTVLNEGKDVYEFVEQNVSIDTIGLSPLYVNEGYLFIDESYKSDLKIYQYQVTVFESADETYRGVNTVYVETARKNLENSFEKVKLNLIRNNKRMPNPATYVISTSMHFPFQATLLPVAKRLLVKHISKNAA